jgi:hypothetical protein
MPRKFCTAPPRSKPDFTALIFPVFPRMKPPEIADGFIRFATIFVRDFSPIPSPAEKEAFLKGTMTRRHFAAALQKASRFPEKQNNSK